MSSSPSDVDPGRWVDEHGDALYRYAMQRLGGVGVEEAAEELVQETFLAALKSKERFEGRSSERTWLIAILRRKVVDEIRRRSRDRAGSGGGEDAAGSCFDRHRKWSPLPGRWPGGAEAAAELPELRMAIRACMEQLPPGLSEAFSLHELEGLTGEISCKVLGITPTNLWSRLHRARMRLRRCLEASWLHGDRSERGTS